jgi:hypothetical protein
MKIRLITEGPLGFINAVSIALMIAYAVRYFCSM